MKQRRTSRWTRPGVEQLEHRLTPSGNVTAALVNGTLVVKGDGGSNDIQITFTDPATVTVSGIPFASPTTVNGAGSASFPAASFSDISVTMRNGNDEVLVEVSVPGALSITAGSANDTLYFGNGASFGNFGAPNVSADSVTIKANSGSTNNDRVTVEFANVAGAAAITTGSGNDNITVNSASFDSLCVHGGNGNTKAGNFFGGNGDVVQVESVTVTGAAAITTGSGNDTVGVNGSALGSLTVNTGGGNSLLGFNGGDTVSVSATTVTGAASITTGSGNDFVGVNGSFSSLMIDTGNGNPRAPVGAGSTFGDTVSVSATNVTGAASITTGSGNDIVGVNGSSFGSLTIATGGGDRAVGTGGDQVTVNTTVAGSASITTGGGNDVVTLGGAGAGNFFTVVGALNVKTGKGYDIVEVGNTTAGSGTVDGGGADDIFKDDGGNLGFSVINFEGFLP